MRRIFTIFVISVLAAGILLSCGKEIETEKETQKQETGPGTPLDYYLQLIETTDIHGHIVNSDDGSMHYRLAYIAYKVRALRERGHGFSRDRLLLLDGGDIYQGACVSNLLGGEPLFTAIDRMGYDAVALGNHEFDWGFENTVDADATVPDYQWQGQTCTNNVPVVCANLYRDGDRVSATRDYVIVEKTAFNAEGDSLRVKIGIIGFATNYAGSIMTSKFTGAGFSIREDYSIARNLAYRLESEGLCDATILLTHGHAESAANSIGTGSVIDLVVGGHSHGTLAGKTSWGLAYLQGGRYAEHFAYCTLRFMVGKDGKVSFLSADHLQTLAVDSSRDIHSDGGQNDKYLNKDILAVSDAALDACAPQLNRVIGYIGVGAGNSSIGGSGGRATPMGNWMCDIIRRIGKADVAFVNSGGIRTTISLNGESRRDITVANVYEIFPFANTIYVYDISYADLLTALEYSLTSGGSSMLSRMTGIDCYYSQGNGAYHVQSLQKDDTVIYENGSWNGDWASRHLKLAVSEYLATTERTDYSTGLPNPFLEWNGTPRLLENSLVDNENAVLVLEAEAAESGGLLWIDLQPHYILN